MNLKDALNNFATDPDYAEYNFQLAKCYEEEKQYASAISFYLRAAEFNTTDLLSYECLIRIYLCFKNLGDRLGIAEGVLLRALSILPTRPEAYYLLSQYYELQKHWQKSYSYACMGESVSIEPVEQLSINIGYFGKDSFIYQKAISGWWIGLFTESIYMLRQLDKKNALLPDYINRSVRLNLDTIIKTFMADAKYGPNLEYPYYLNRDSNKYFSSLYHRFKFKFNGLDSIEENYSQCYQDMFVLATLDGKTHGIFLEIGCGIPKYNNNTYLLETKFNWKGISIDINPEVIRLHKKDRNSTAIHADATKIDYVELLKDYQNLDYLQIDCEPSSTSYEILKRIPFELHKFAVITFEHEYYIDENPEIKRLSREYLTSLGYVLVAGDISMDKYNTFEDWWVYPELINSDILHKMICKDDKIRNVEEYMLTNKT